MWNSKRKQELIKVVRDSRVYDSQTDWFLINKIWYKPAPRELFYSLLLEFWQQELANTAGAVLLYPEGRVASFGAIPFVSMLAHDLGHSMVIWQEDADIVTTASLFYPDLGFFDKNRSCIIVQDVVGKGTTLRKLYKQLSEVKWTISYYVTIIQIRELANHLDENISFCRERKLLSDDFRFVPLLFDSDIR